LDLAFEMEYVVWSYREMASTDTVLDKFKSLHGQDWTSLESQEIFGHCILEDPVSTLYPPAKKYQLSVLKQFIAAIEEEGDGSMADILMEALLRLSTVRIGDEDSCYLSYPLPGTSGMTLEETVTLRVNPRHNEVGLRPWEAAFKLADYVVASKEIFAGQRVLELGSGVGFTGLVAAQCTCADTICMTDYAPEVLANLRYNIALNQQKTVDDQENFSGTKNVQVESLDWNCPKDSVISLDEWDIILAADIFYDREQIPKLVELIAHLLQPNLKQGQRKNDETHGSLVMERRFLSESHEQMIKDNQKNAKDDEIPLLICAYTLRNEETLAFVLSCLEKHNIFSEEIPQVSAYEHYSLRYNSENKDNVFICKLRIGKADNNF